MLTEVNFDGLVGPTHNYAGLSYGNVASEGNAGAGSRPRAAALQGIAKMRALMGLGLVQGVLPPQERPHVPTLRRLGFVGNDAEVIEKAARADPVLLAQVNSASVMWTANAATVGPSADCADGRLHLTPANLVTMFHRSIEADTTARVLRAVFPTAVVHDPLPASPALGDEGAANHTRLFDDRGPTAGAGVHLFVYGAHFGNKSAAKPGKYPARQTLEASRGIARLHGLDQARRVFAQQNPAVVDMGVFHNDVICVGNGRVLLHHERAFAEGGGGVLKELERLVGGFTPVVVREAEVPVELAVKAYLFNSQLVTLAGGQHALIAPTESREEPRVKAVIDRIVADGGNPIGAVHYMDVRESMRNGGGPACLRLRVPMTGPEIAAVTPGCIMNADRLVRLEEWVRRHYREELRPGDLADPKLVEESRGALDDLTGVLGIGRVFEFQG